MCADITGAMLDDASLTTLRAIDPASLPVVEGTPRLGACVGNIGKFMCIGLNYSDHAAETGMPIPEHPILFIKANSAIVGPNDDVMMPRGSTQHRLGGRTGRGDRQGGEIRHARQMRWTMWRAIASSTMSPSGTSRTT